MYSYPGTETVVLWDLHDCKVPNDLDGVSAFRNISHGLYQAGYCGRVKIFGYGDFCSLGDSFGEEGIPICHCADSKASRSTILVDFLTWAIRSTYKVNLMLIVGDISSHEGFCRGLRYLKSKESHDVILVQPEVMSSELRRHVSSACLWESLLCDPRPIKHVKSTHVIDTEQYVRAKTAVFWDMEGCPIPGHLDAGQVSQNIRSALAAADCDGTVSIYGYSGTLNTGGLESLGIVPKYYSTGGDKEAKLQKILVDLICCAIDNPDTKNYMLILGDISEHLGYEALVYRLLAYNYKCLLAQPRNAREQLLHSVSAKWLWDSLAAAGRPFFQLS